MKSKALIKKVDCVRLHVSDLEAGLAFYREKLGLELAWKTEASAGLIMPEDETEIVLHIEKKKPEIDLLVEDADKAADDFVKVGGKVVAGPFDIQIGRCVVVNDPFGNELVLLDASKGLLETDEDGNVTGNKSLD